MCRCQEQALTSQRQRLPQATLALDKALIPNAKTPASKRGAWLARSMAQRTVSHVKSEVELRTGKSLFLQTVQPQPHICQLAREEIQLGTLVGRGGFSEVYQVTATSTTTFLQEDEHETSQQFVMKHLRQDLLANRTKFQGAAADLALEAEFLARFRHPHIARLHGWSSAGIAGFGGESHDGFFLLLEQYDCTLAEQIQDWKAMTIHKDTTCIPHLDIKVLYARQIASALEYLHEHRLLYRDLKPDNIGILNGSIQLFDFGLCRELPESGVEDERYTMTGVGTWRYMAPEVVLHQYYNQKADVFSFAMVLHELLFHEKPFDLYNFELHKLLVCGDGERPNIPCGCPTSLANILEQSWTEQPEQRLSMAQVRVALAQVCTEEASSSNPWSLFRTVWDTIRTRTKNPHQLLAGKPQELEDRTSRTLGTLGNTSTVEDDM